MLDGKRQRIVRMTTVAVVGLSVVASVIALWYVSGRPAARNGTSPFEVRRQEAFLEGGSRSDSHHNVATGTPPVPKIADADSSYTPLEEVLAAKGRKGKSLEHLRSAGQVIQTQAPLFQYSVSTD